MNKLLKIHIHIVIVLFSMVTNAQRYEATLPVKDIFATACFQRNILGLIPEYDGQSIRYFADHDGVTVFLTDAGPIYKLVKGKDRKKVKEKDSHKEHETKNNKAIGEEEDENKEVHFKVAYIKASWLGANPHPVIEAMDKSSGHFSYLAGQRRADIHSIVTEGFSKLIYHDVYPGIDVLYTFPEQGGMKYDFIIHPGADPGLIKINYTGPISQMKVNRDGDLSICTKEGSLIEHAPISYTPAGRKVATSYLLNGHHVSIAVQDSYDHSQTLTIDPWVSTITQLTVKNMGFDVDYDVTGNLLVYGAGSVNQYDVVNFQKLAKYNTAGVFLWVFMGSVPSVNWNSAGNGTVNSLSDAKVDRISGKVYVGCAFDYMGGTQVIRLDSNGVYDNFISAQNASFQELWSFAQNCATGDIIAMGGGLSSNLNLAIINPSAGTVTTSNFTGIPFTSYARAGSTQDIVCGAEDPYQNLYVVMASLQTPSVNNVIYKVSSNYSGVAWGPVPTGYTSFREAHNLPGYDPINGGSNNFNALAADRNYLYYYDGKNLAVFNASTGAAVGTPVSLSGGTALTQGGIAVDGCQNVYIGSKGNILTYSFNGTTFIPGTSISLGANYATDTIFDIRYNPLNNLLYVAGTHVAGTFVATLSTTCVSPAPFSDTITADCTSATVTILDTAGQNNGLFSFVWRDSLGNIIQQTALGASLSNTMIAPHSGLYTVQIQYSENCILGNLSRSIEVISCNSLTISPKDTTICAGQQVTITATGLITGGTYLWTPGSATTASITVSPTDTTMYIVQYTPPTGQPMFDTSIVSVVSQLTGSSLGPRDTVICSGVSLLLGPTPVPIGAAFLWQDGTTTTTYSVTQPGLYVLQLSNNCSILLDSITVVTRTAPLAYTLASAGLCPGSKITLLPAPAPLVGDSLVWQDGITHTDSFIASAPGLYTLTEINTCGQTSASAMISLLPLPMVTIDTVPVQCDKDSVMLNIVETNAASYLWNTGSTDSSIYATATGHYSVAVSNSCGTAHDSVNVTFLSSPIKPFNGLTIDSCRGAQIILDAQNHGDTYSWSNGLTQQIITVMDSGNYYVTISDRGYCPVTDYVYIIAHECAICRVVEPNAFSPNGDGKNDIFKPIFECSVESYSMTIYDRWGQLVFETADQSTGWDGTYKSKAQPIGVYMFFVHYRNTGDMQESSVAGNLTLLR